MSDVFRIIPPKMSSYILILIILAFLAAICILFMALLFSIKNIRFVIGEDRFQIKSLFYGREISLRDIDQASVKVVDLNNEPDLKPRLRTNGIGLPGFWSGWFRLKNKAKALLFVTDRTRVVLFTTPDFSVMLSSEDPEGLSDRLISALR
ncbi:MAG: hypothetical protein JXJ04_01660 [Spirochaetales bacterium]|nr:hypothetical protein [Spirochaetales bacterium]